MTQAKSQITIPINPSVLFTTLVGLALVGLFGYFAVTLPNQISALNDEMKKISHFQQTHTEKLSSIMSKVTINTESINEIKLTRFRKDDAQSLANAITADFKIEMSNWFTDIMVLKKEVVGLDNRLKKVETN